MSPTLLFAALAIAAPALKDPPTSPGIEGEWMLETRLVGGKPDQGAKSGSSKFIITRDKWTIADTTGKPLEWALELETAARPPTMTLFKADDMGRRGQPEMSGIYQVEGDTLTICYVFKGARPTGFVSPAGTDIRLMTLKRVKDK
jgi:uncharacterized protein (TIGR03067 family)